MARTVSLSEAAVDVRAAMNALPNPEELPPGTLVIVPGAIAGAPSLARSVMAVFRRPKTVTPAIRCSALVARGYVRVGAVQGDDDIAWGYAPDEER